MDIQTEKLRLIELLLHTNSPSVINRIKSIFQLEESQDIWEELSSSQQKEIDRALLEVEEGNTIPYDTFIEKHR
jgi:predicted Zn-ribbon and HTH transcriptional regulator